MLDLIGHIFCLLKAVGLLQLSRKRQIGWAFRIAGGAGWTVLGFHMGLSSIWIWGLVFLITDVIGFVSWSES
jgi:hypothetical protein